MRKELTDIELDDVGRVVLSNEQLSKLEGAFSEAAVAGGMIRSSNSGCVNEGDCTSPTANDGCINTGGCGPHNTNCS